MIKVMLKEYREGDYGVREIKVTFLGIPLYYSLGTTTNNMAVRQLTVSHESRLKMRGFNEKS